MISQLNQPTNTLHSNMVRFIIDERSYIYRAKPYPLHSNMVRFIIH